jgi:hypothetical protein
MMTSYFELFKSGLTVIPATVKNPYLWESPQTLRTRRRRGDEVFWLKSVSVAATIKTMVEKITSRVLQ